MSRWSLTLTGYGTIKIINGWDSYRNDHIGNTRNQYDDIPWVVCLWLQLELKCSVEHHGDPFSHSTIEKNL